MLRFLLSGPRFEGMLILGERPLARQERLILTTGDVEFAFERSAWGVSIRGQS